MKKITLILCLFLCFGVVSIKAQYTNLLNFNGTNGANPLYSSLVASGNIVYGMTEFGGANNKGCVFSVDTNGTGYVDLLDFNGANGSEPMGSLILSGSTLYGMTSVGGTNNDGCIFSIHTNGTGYADLFNFNGTNGSHPMGALTLSGTTLYGMASAGGANSDGVIFSISTGGSGYTTLLSFNGTNGKTPYGSLTLSGNVLYGMTELGGANAKGCIFSINTNGSGYATLLSFNGTDGKNPYGSLLLSGTTLYGMTSSGGASSDGVIFSINKNGTGYIKLLSFNGTNGKTPYGSLTLTLPDSALYGLTSAGGTNNDGCLFSVNMDGTSDTNLLNFNSTSSFPYSSLTSIGNKLFGTTVSGGVSNKGIVFAKVKPLIVKAKASPTHTCNGEAVNLFASAKGGLAPYAFHWSAYPATGFNCATCQSAIATPTVTTLFKVRVTDNLGHTDSVLININVSTPINIALSTNAAHPCKDATVDLKAIVSGGTAPYSYIWSPGTPLNNAHIYNPFYTANIDRTFTCKIIDNLGCIKVSSSLVEDIDHITVTIPTGNKICPGATDGSLTANITSSFTPYTYTWSPAGGIHQIGTGLSAGTYTVTVKDNNGCSATHSNTVNTYIPPTVNVPAVSVCHGDSATLIPTVSGGGTPYTYFWVPSTGLNCVTCKKPHAGPLSTTSYTVRVTDDHGCTGTASVLVTVHPLPIVSVFSSGSACSGNVETLTATGASTYTWTPSTGLNATTGATVTASPYTSITYTVTGTNSNGCKNTATIHVNDNTGYRYTSVAAGGNWSNPATWTGGPAGTVPSYMDTAVIASSVTEDMPYCVSKVRVNAGKTLTISANASVLNVYREVVNNGAITGGTYIHLFGSSMTVISGTGTYTGVSWWFEGNHQTIDAVVDASLSRDIVLGTQEAGVAVSVKNSGKVILVANKVYNDGTYSSSWTNEANSTLTVGEASLTNSNDDLYASATNNTVNFEGASAYNIKQPVSNTFYNLGIAGTKSLPAATLDVSGKITVNGANDVLNIAGNTINLTGNLVNNGTVQFTTGQLNIAGSFTNNKTFTAGTGTITFNGTGTQNFTSVNSSETFNNLKITSTSNLVTNSILNVNAINSVEGTMTVQ